MSRGIVQESSVQKEPSMVLQKQLIGDYYESLGRARAEGRRVVSTFVPGNLTELLRSFDLLPILPEINALQSGMRKLSANFIAEAEKQGHSEDVCTYVKCDIGMLKSGNVGPTGVKLPNPDLLLLSYTGCFTFLKWFELLREEYQCPVAMLHVPYLANGRIEPHHVDYVVQQLRTEVIPKLEQISGRRYDEARLEYYRVLREEIAERIRLGLGPVTPEGTMEHQRYRLVMEGPPNWTSFREFWKMFYDEGAVVVASSYTKVGGLYDRGFRHDPNRPLESLAEYCLGCYTNLGLPARVDLLERYIREYHADGFMINSVKSCNSFSVGQLLMLRQLEQRTGVPGGFIESDLVDPRYFSPANIKNRIESYLQMLAQRRGTEVTA